MKSQTIRLCAVVLAALVQLGLAQERPPAEGPPKSNVRRLAEETFLLEPLVWLGAEPPKEKDASELLGLLVSIQESGRLRRLDDYLEKHPDSGWGASLRAQHATTCREFGRYGVALRHWESAWKSTRHYTSGEGKKVADYVLAHWSQLLASLGRRETLEALFAENKHRNLGYYQSTYDRSLTAAGMMRDHPSLAFRCGTLALYHVAGALKVDNNEVGKLTALSSPTNGFSITMLLEFAGKARLKMVAVERKPGDPIAVPSVVHWRENHYAAILSTADDCYEVVDPTFGRTQWLHKSVIDEEASGKFLVPEKLAPGQWRRLTKAEMDGTRGMGIYCDIFDFTDEGKNSFQQDCSGLDGSLAGMPRWWVTEPYLNLWMADEPVFYNTSSGPIGFRLYYRQRDNDSTFPLKLKPGVFAPRSGMSDARWSHQWNTCVFFRDNTYDANFALSSGTITNIPSYAVVDAMLLLPQGGARSANFVYNWLTQRTEQKEERSKESFKVRSGTTLALGGALLTNGLAWQTNGTAGFAMVYPDGSQDVYGYAVRESSGNNIFAFSSKSSGKAYLTSKIDARGNVTLFGYQSVASTSTALAWRLKHVVDCDRRTNTFTHHPTYPDQITEVATPFGQRATIKYDNYQRITNIVDAAGLASSITYAGTNGYVKQLITPYGTNGFEIHDYSSALGADGSRSIGGHYVARAIQVTEPNGGKQLFLYRYETPTNWTHIPDTYPSSQVPVGWFVGNVPRLTAPAAPVELRTTLDNGTQLNGSPTASLKYRNSFYWSRKQSGGLSISDLGAGLANINNLTENDYKLAWWRHWLEQSVARTNSSAAGIPVVSDRIGIERLPSADGTNVGAVTWYGYFKPSGTANHQTSSTEALPNVIARILADGTTQFSVLHYNPLGAVTNLYSTYTDITNNTRAIRLWNFQYAANHIDLLKVTGPQGVLQTFGYNSGHQVEAITNGVGDVTRIGYMGGLLRRIDYPTKFRRTFDYGYSTVSVESSTTGPVRPATTLDDNFVKQIVDGVSGATVSLTYNNGAVRTITDPRGLRATNTWDGLFRLTGVTFSNQTVISNQFSRLDYVGFRDQATNWTRAGYNAMGQVTMLTNANGAVTGFGYCTCGALTLVTNFHSLGPPYVIGVTTNNYDRQLRLTSVNHPDGSTWTYKYDQWGWLTNLSDGAGRTFTFGYNHQGLMTSVSNAFGLVRQIQYDAMDRPVYVINGNLTGGRDYTALKYDLIGRPTNVVVASVNGSPSGSYGYTYASNRLASVTDPYGKITRYNYDGAGRLIILTNANNEVLRFSYNPAGDLLTLTDARNQVTTWKYDEFGRLTNKLDSANRKVYDLAYTVNGWLAAKTVADVSLTTAKTTNVGVGTITYGYDKVGNLLQKQVPNVGTYLYYYDALNRLEEMWDPGTGTQSGIVPAIARPKPYGTTFSYTPMGQLTAENGPWTADALTATYAQGLRTGLGIEAPSGSAWSQGYTYDSARRLKTVTNSVGTFTYDYSLSLNEPNRISFPGGMNITNVFELSGKVRETTLRNSSGTTLGYHGYQFDLAGRTTNHVRLTSSKWAYQYDAIGQLTNAIGREANNTVRLHEKLSYRYDAAGNLIYRTNNALVQSLVVTNNGNELTKISRSGTYTVSGVVVGATNVTVNGLTASLYLDGGFARDGLSLVNGQNTFTVIAKGGGVSATNQVTVTLPDPVAFTHDARGNLLNDGQPLLAYDAEDQLTSIRVPPTATASGWETQFVYDGLGRLRIRREITVPATGSTTARTTNQVRYLYDGFTAVQERDGNNAVLATYTRGNDLSGSPQGAGGIGGLLARTDAGGSVFYHADAGGNVTTLFNAAQAVVGRYAYDPFGNLLGMSGAGAAGNRYRFSSKEVHPQTGMYYYGFRFYEPNLQRWTSRDPIEEMGGINLYGFVGNEPTDFIDPLGLAETGFGQMVSDFFLGNRNTGKWDPNSQMALRGGPSPLSGADGVNISPGDLTAQVGGIVLDAGTDGLWNKFNPFRNFNPSGSKGPMSNAVSKPGKCPVISLTKAASADPIRKHHSWAKYLGGAEKQDLVPLPKSVHDAYHSGLDKILPRQKGTKHYEGLSGAAKDKMYRDLGDYTKAFDAKNGTKLFDAMLKEGFPVP